MAKPSRRLPQSAQRSTNAKHSGGKSSRKEEQSNSSFLLWTGLCVLLVAFALWNALPSKTTVADSEYGHGADSSDARSGQQQQDDEMVENLAKRTATPEQGESSGSDAPPESHVTEKQNEQQQQQQRVNPAVQKEKDWKPTTLNSLQMSSSFEVAGRRIYPRSIKLKLSERKRTTHVKMYTMDNILTAAETNGLIQAHDNYAGRMTDPIFCFDSEKTMQSHLQEHAELRGLKLVDADFTEGTTCLNTSMSRVLNGYIKYSVSTAFYTGESKFSHEMDKRIESATGMPASHGGKYQVTSYGPGVGYKTHTDCVVGSSERRDRFATVLVYLNDVPSGGQTVFPELGVEVEPRRARSVVWNSMSADGVCDGTSVHNASKVESGRKVILQRWYYYHTFPLLGKRFNPPALPKRGPDQPVVNCDLYDSGSCRMYDEWQYHHIKAYVRQHQTMRK